MSVMHGQTHIIYLLFPDHKNPSAFLTHPEIRHVFFNSKTSCQLLKTGSLTLSDTVIMN